MVPFPGEESDNFIMHVLRIMAMLVEYWEGTQGKTSHCSSVESGGCLDRCARRGYLLIQKGRRHRHHEPHPSTHRPSPEPSWPFNPQRNPKSLDSLDVQGPSDRQHQDDQYIPNTFQNLSRWN